MSFFTPISNEELNKIIAYTDDIMAKETPHSSPIKSKKKSVPKAKGEVTKSDIKIDDVDDIIRAVNKERGIKFEPKDEIPEIKVIKDSNDVQMERAIAKILPHAIVNGNDINQMTDIKPIITLIKSRSYTDAEVPLILDKIKRLGATDSTLEMVKRFINSQSTSNDIVPFNSPPSDISLLSPPKIEEKFTVTNNQRKKFEEILRNFVGLKKHDHRKIYKKLSGKKAPSSWDKPKLIATNSTLEMAKRLINSQSTSNAIVPFNSPPSDISSLPPPKIKEEFTFTNNQRKEVREGILRNFVGLKKLDHQNIYIKLSGKKAPSSWSKPKLIERNIPLIVNSSIEDDGYLKKVTNILIKKGYSIGSSSGTQPTEIIEAEGYKRRSKSKRNRR